ncbi:hypothetical protein N8306_01970 [Yoonia sp.]|nr:hypothetical protein [Yoonia sp.]
MSATRIDDDYLYFLIFGSGYIDNPWSHIWGRNDYFNDHWKLFVRPTVSTSDVGLVDMALHDEPNIGIVYTKSYSYNSGGDLVYSTDSGAQDLRTADRLTLNHHDVGPEAPFKLALQGVDFVDAPVGTETHFEIITKGGFSTDGTIASLIMNVGHHEMTFTGAARDSEIFMGSGYDKISFEDHLDVPGEQFWAVVRRADGELDAYSLFSGYRVQLGDGYKGWTSADSTLMNYGEIEEISIGNSRTGGSDVYLPGVDLPNVDDRGTLENIDLRSDGEEHSDSFNLAYFNFIRYTSDNVWAGQATVHDGVNYSTPGDRTVTSAKYGTGVYAPVLGGTMSVIGQSRNGTHDLIVEEQANAIDGVLRLYTFDVQSKLYNEFNTVFLGSAANDTSVESSIATTDWSDRVALYGFGGEDVLLGGAGRDYLFGGQSTYNQLNNGETGNQVTGGIGADYFGVGNTDSAGTVTGANVTIASSTIGAFHQGYATDVIMDWHAGEDTLVVLSNGVAVIDGLRDGSGTLDMGVSNTIDLRSYTAIATSDQDADGARGGDTWDTNQSLLYIFENQATRDSQSISNEADITVVNDGLIVARGFNGADTLHGSAGDDYLYGNEGADLVNLNAGGTDRVYIDTFDSELVSSNSASVYVTGFDGVNDQVFLNKRVIDAFSNVYDSTSSSRVLSAADVGGTYTQAIAYDRSINFLHDKFYQPSIYDTNENHRNNDGRSAFGDNSGTNTSSGFGGADGTTFIIGTGMVAAGYALMAIPFVGPAIGLPLIASGGLLGAIGVISPTQEHENATFDGVVRNYLNVITSDTSATVTTTAATSSAKNSDNVTFLDFFGGNDAGDGYVPVVEFTAHAGQGIHGYFALHSAGGDKETFVYLVSSSDNLVDNSEAIKVAEINGHLTAEDFKVYDGEADIYNVGVEPQIVLRTPTIASVVDQNNDFAVQASDDPANSADNDKLIEKGGTPNPNHLEIAVQLNGARTVGTTINIYDGRTLIYSGDETTSTENSAGLVSAAYNSGTNTFTITDGRDIGTVAFDTTTGEIASETTLDGVDNNLILRDSIVNYSIELIDGVTGISTRTSSGAITVSGGNTLIDGGTQTGSGMDILNVSGTVAYINETADINVVGIETIMVSAVDTNGSAEAGNAAIDDGDDSPVLDLSKQSDGFKIYGSTLADQITGSTGNDDISGLGGGNTIQLTSSGAGLAGSGADRVRFNYASDRLGSDTGYDIILGMHTDDELFIETSADLDTDNNPDTALETIKGFEDRDGDTTRLMYETSTAGQNMRVASGTELLVIETSAISTSGDLTNDIAAALGSAFDLSGLDGRTPSASTGAGMDSSLLFAVKSNTGSYWVGRYEDTGDDDKISGDTDIEILANVSTSDILNSFWLDTELAPQELTIILPSTLNNGTGQFLTQETTFSVGGLQAGNQVYYTLNGGNSWQTAAVDQTTISLNQNQSNDIQVRQVSGSNYSPETTAVSTSVEQVKVIWDTDSPTTNIGLLEFTSLGLYSESTFNGKPYYIDVGVNDHARLYFDFDDVVDIASDGWGSAATPTFGGKYEIVNAIKVHDLDDQNPSYDNGLQDLGIVYYQTDEKGRLTIDTVDFAVDDTSGADTRLFIDIDIPLAAGGIQNFQLDVYIDWTNSIV